MGRSQQTSEQGGNSRPFRAQLAPPTRSAPLVGGKVVRRLRARGVRTKEEGTPEVTGQESPPPELSTLVLFRVKSGVNTGPQPPPLLQRVWGTLSPCSQCGTRLITGHVPDGGLQGPQRSQVRTEAVFYTVG